MIRQLETISTFHIRFIVIEVVDEERARDFRPRKRVETRGRMTLFLRSRIDEYLYHDRERYWRFPQVISSRRRTNTEKKDEERESEPDDEVGENHS